MSDLKVGDLLAFNVGMGSGEFRVYPIDKITPSGRIKCGNYELNQNLTIRGEHRWGPYRGEIVTEAIMVKYRRQENIKTIIAINFKRMSNESLDNIVDIINAEKAKNK